MKKQLIIFDLDGTLIDTLSDIEHIFNYVLIQNGYQERSKSFYKNNIGNGFENLLRKCLPDNFKGDFDFLANSVRDRYESHLNTKTIVFDGITTVLEHLKKNKVKIAVIDMAFIRLVDLILLTIISELALKTKLSLKSP